MDAKGAKALVERLAREGLYATPAAEAEQPPRAELRLADPVAEPEDFAAGGTERAA